MATVRDDSWQDRAACRGGDVEVFYSTDEADIRAALAYCERCEVRVQCREWAMVHREAFGVWGGTVDTDRRRVFRQERRRREHRRDHDAA